MSQFFSCSLCNFLSKTLTYFFVDGGRPIRNIDFMYGQSYKQEQTINSRNSHPDVLCKNKYSETFFSKTHTQTLRWSSFC